MHGCWVELPLCNGPESFATVPETGVTFTVGGSDVRGAGFRYAATPLLNLLRASREALSRVASSMRYMNLRDWRGGLLLRCSGHHAPSSPASCCGPVFSCGVSLATTRAGRGSDDARGACPQ